LSHSLENQDIKGGKLNVSFFNEISFDVEPKKPPLGIIPSTIGLLLFLAALAGGIVNLPSFLMLKNQSVYIKVVWKHVIMLGAITPFALLDMIIGDALILDMVSDSLVPMFFLTILYCAYVYMVYFAVTQTFIAHTLLLCSIGTTFTTAWKIVRKLPFTRLEYLGIAANVFGAYLCCCEGASIASMHTIHE